MLILPIYARDTVLLEMGFPPDHLSRDCLRAVAAGLANQISDCAIRVPLTRRLVGGLHSSTPDRIRRAYDSYDPSQILWLQTHNSLRLTTLQSACSRFISSQREHRSTHFEASSPSPSSIVTSATMPADSSHAPSTGCYMWSHRLRLLIWGDEKRPSKWLEQMVMGVLMATADIIHYEIV